MCKYISNQLIILDFVCKVIFSNGVWRIGTFMYVLERLKTDGVLDFFQLACLQRVGLVSVIV